MTPLGAGYHSTYAASLSSAFDCLTGSGWSYCCRCPVKRKRALLGSNPPRNSRLETHSDGREPIGTGRFPPLDGFPSQQLSSIGVDLPIPEKPTLAISLPRRDGNRLGER